MMKLRPHQDQGAAEIRAAFRQFKCVLFVGPTAFGKTNLFSYIAKMARQKDSRIVIIAHRQELIHQISETLSKWGVDHGIISPQFSPSYFKQVQVASVQTLASRFRKIPEKFRQFDLMVQDECHHLVATNSFGKVYELLGKPRLLGVTATPERADGKGLGESAGGVFQTLIEVIGVRELIDEAFLSNYRVYAPPSEIDLSGVRTRMGDFDKQELAEQVDRPKVVGDAAAHYARICPGVPAIAFGISIEHCHHIASAFQTAGFNFQVIDGTMTAETRKRLIKGLGRDIHGLVSADLISEGTDIPGVTAAIFLRPTKSLGLYIQQAGRALRTVFADGYDLSTREGRLAAIANGPKPCAYIIDHVGNTLRHGLVDAPREWSLDGRVKKKGKNKDEQEQRIDIVQCPKCFVVSEPTPVCPHCGHVFAVKGGRNLDHVDGELQEITPEMREAMAEKERMKQRSAQAAAKSVEDMMNQLGYSRGRAEAIVKAREEKAAIRISLINDLQAWHKRTGQSPVQVLGIYLSDLKMMKPKALADMRAKFDKHRLTHLGAQPGDDANFAEYLQDTLLPTDSQPSGEAAF